jgi:hypothetical protein
MHPTTIVIVVGSLKPSLIPASKGVESGGVVVVVGGQWVTLAPRAAECNLQPAVGYRLSIGQPAEEQNSEEQVTQRQSSL